MMIKSALVLFLLFCLNPKKSLSQNYDSLHVYAVYMYSMYMINMDKDLIKNEVDPIKIENQQTIKDIYFFLTNTVKGSYLKNIKSNQLDVRLTFEFFKNNRIIQTFGFTHSKKMFINNELYSYDIKKLKQLDKYITGLSKILNVR